MQNTSARYKSILSGNHTKEVKVDVYTTDGSKFVNSFGMNRLTAMKTSNSLFSNGGFKIGSCVSGKLDVSFYPTDESENPVAIPKMARLIPMVRLVSDGGETSEWLKKGVYFIDTRDVDDSTGILSIQAFDAMLKTEQDFDTFLSNTYPIKDIDAVRFIARQIGVEVDYRTVSTISRGYSVPMPIEYSCREVLSGLGVAYGVCFCISDEGKLLAVSPLSAPTPTRYLVDDDGRAHITFGGVRILV